MEQNTNQQAPEQQQPQNNEQQGFDMSKVTTAQWITSGAAFLGLISVFLPWGVWNAGFFKVSMSGISSFMGVGVYWAGYLSLIVYGWVIAITLFDKSFKMDQKMKDMTIKYGAVLPFVLGLIALLYIIGKDGSIGFGLILDLLAAIALFLLGNKIIKLK